MSTKYQPQEGYVVIQYNISDQPILCFRTEDSEGNDSAEFFKTTLEAKKAIVEHYQDIIEAIEKGDMTEDSLEFGDRIYWGEIDEDGNFVVTDPDNYDQEVMDTHISKEL